ncbi:MAG TPA: amino acid adenylation domain-containing protein [Conexibacter sp.]|nr:amino acid adenylation domain-containing protein [Conexibacter sp.]
MTTLLQDYATRAAAERGDGIAVALGEDRLSYAQLDALSDRLAARLVDAGCVPGDRVGLLMPKQPLSVVAIQAALKAGCAYLPLDPESPPVRLARIVETAEPRVLLSVPEAAAALDAVAEALASVQVWSMTVESVAGERARSALTRTDWDVDVAPPGVRVGPDDPAYLLFTSGSTGWPKGVVITHRNVIAFSDWAVDAFDMSPGDRHSGHPPLHFDLSTFDLHPTFAAGAELQFVPAGLGLDARALADFIRTSKLTQWCSVPSVLTYMAGFDVVAEGDFPALERITWCGEVLPTAVLAHWMRRLPHVSFTNMYGPTEATCASSWHPISAVPDDESVAVPIGRACPGEELLVLDDQLAPVSPDEIGDLYIAGVGLSPGYWRDEEKTASAFLSDPRVPGSAARIYKTGDLARVDEDGVFHYVGRADSQIKSRGYRIELGEIESAFNAIEGVRECAVVGVEAEGFGGVAICAAYVADSGLRPPVLRRLLVDVLPPYMLPARWLVLDALPKNQNGKTDRPALREQFAEQAAERRRQRA